jgi:hypothetical protein
MSTFPEKHTRDANETITALPEQYPVPLTHSKEETATEGFSWTFLPNLANSATALTEQVMETVAAATTLTVEGIQQVGTYLPQPTVDGIVQQLPTSVVYVMECAAASSQALQTLTRTASSASATAQQALAIASKVQLLMVKGVPHVYDYLQQGDLGGARQCGEQVLSELAAEQSAAAALAAVALDIVTSLATLQEDVKADLCQVTGAAGEQLGGTGGRLVAEHLTRAALPTFNVLSSIKKHS